MIRLLERDQDGARGKMLYSHRQRPRVSPECRGAKIDPGAQGRCAPLAVVHRKWLGTPLKVSRVSADAAGCRLLRLTDVVPEYHDSEVGAWHRDGRYGQFRLHPGLETETRLSR